MANILKSSFGSDGDVIYDNRFQLLLLANLIAPLGTALLSPIIESLIGPLGTSPAKIGLLMSFYSAPSILTIPLAGIFADRLGRKPVLVVSLLIFGGAGAAIAFTTNFTVVLALRLLQGVAFGGITPIIITCLGDLYEGEMESTAEGLRFSGSGLAQVIFPSLSGALVGIAWQYPFLLYAMSIPVAILFYVGYNPPTVSAPTSSKTTGADSTGAHLRSLVGLLMQRRVFAMVIARGLPMAVWIGFLTYNSVSVVRNFGGSSAQAGMMTAAASLALTLSSSQTGQITAYFDDRRSPLIGANVCLGIGFAVFMYASTLWVAGFGIALAGVGLGIGLSTCRSVITSLAGDTMRGGLVSSAEAFGRVVSTATPIVMGSAIAVVAPSMGVGSAVRIVGLGVAICAAGGGLLCLLLAGDLG